ncbi:MAG TPA: hypothetical protein VJU84_17550 [Pyrinomonadaceae bacterium]|nr:hypothetical protein [Pyrinomonadaceae bacterium]
MTTLEFEMLDTCAVRMNHEAFRSHFWGTLQIAIFDDTKNLPIACLTSFLLKIKTAYGEY